MCEVLTAKHIPQMVDIHNKCFESAWSIDDFQTHLTLSSDDILGIVHAGKLQAFVLSRFAVDQAEILTIAVAPKAQKNGLATRLLTAMEVHLHARGAQIVFLEVACDNIAAIRLYENQGYHKFGTRPRYYRHDIDGITGRVDANLYQKQLA